MAKKMTSKKKVKSVKTASKHGGRLGKKMVCSICGRKGFNARSHGTH